MNYKFYKKTIDTTQTTYYMVDTDKDTDVLMNFDFTIQNYKEIDNIIDGVKSTIDTDVEYQWANEDVHLLSDKNAVFFWDLMSMRGGASKVKEKQDLDLPHEEFIAFMEDFKKFIEENS